MQHPDRLRRPHPGVHQAKVDARLDTIEANATNIKNNFVGHTRSTLDRLDTIESEIKVMTQIITENSLALDKIEKRIAIMQEKIDGID